jgi:hypothetical protein
MHGTGAAQRHTTTEFSAGHTELIAQSPEYGRVFRQVYLMLLAIDGKNGHCCSFGG